MRDRAPGVRRSAGYRRYPAPGREDRVEAIDHRLVAADHHAIATVDSPDAAAGADVDIMNAAFLQRLAAPYVVLPERVAAIDDDVAGLHQLRQGSIVASVILPAGNITQAARGL